MALISFAVVAFFAADARGESMLVTKVMPVLVMTYLFVIIFHDFGALTGTTGIMGWLLPGLTIIFAVIGFVLASMLAARDPARFAAYGRNKV